MKKRLISIMLVIATAATLLTSCATSNNGSKDNSEDTPAEYDGLVIDNEYSVIRSEKANKMETKLATNVWQQINQKASLKLIYKTDFYKKAEEISEKEILVGNTNREIEFDRTTLKEGEYYIGIEGKKIIIDAYDEAALHYAVEEFTSKWLSTDLGIQKDGTLVFNDTMCAALNGLSLFPQNTITVLSQNMYYSEENRATRMQRFQQIIDTYDPDLIGTQETTKQWLNDFKTKLGDKYGVVGCSRDGRNATSGEWNAVLYKLDRFELVESDTFWLSKTPSEKSVVSGSKCYRICTWALLKDKQTKKLVIMANTHLDHGEDTVREQQADILVNYFKNKYPNYPVYLTGDFNCEPDSLAYKTVTSRWLDSHQNALVNKSNTIYTFSATNPVKEIDFCFYNDKSFPIYYYVINEQILGGYVSDHYGVLAEFAVK